MKRLYLCIAGLMCMAVLLSACGVQNTPQDVARAFWDSVIDDNAGAAVKYSTLRDVRNYDGFAQDWGGFQMSFGRVIIEGDEASIVSEISRRDSPGTDSRKFLTYLVRQEGQWKVDYAHTGADLHGGPFATLFGQINQLGKAISDQFRTSSEDLNKEFERLSEKLAKLSDTVGRQASANIERFAEQLRRRIQELSDSVERALREQEGRLSDRDKGLLTEVVSDLNEGSKNLTRPSMQSIADGSNTIRSAERKLASTDDEVVGKYKERWREIGERVAADMRGILDELSVWAERRR